MGPEERIPDVDSASSDDHKSKLDDVDNDHDAPVVPDLEKGDEKRGRTHTRRATLAYLDQFPTLPAGPTGEDAGTLRLQRMTSRASSVRSTRRPHVDGPARVVGEFRTLSIHVQDTKDGKAPDVRRAKKEVQELAAIDLHVKPIEEILALHSVSPTLGLDTAQAARRLQANGKNSLTPPPRNLIRRWAMYFLGGFGSLLLTACVLVFVAWRPLGEPNPQVANLALAVVLLIVLVWSGLFNAWQDWSTQQTMSSITAMLPSDVFAIRDGKQIKIAAENLVLGDLVKISMGAKVPADLRMLSCDSDMRIDRSILTGESDAIPVTLDSTSDNFMETKNIALQGTLVVAGSGIGIVVQTGDTTVFGRIAKLSSRQTGGLSTLEKEVYRFVGIIATMAISVALALLIVWAAWLRTAHPEYMTTSQLIVNLVSIIVAFVPEGLPICVTLSLTVIANAMKKNQVLCKSLVTVETLGAVNVICSDKTGTLTQNKMKVQNVATVDEVLPVLIARDRMIKGDPDSHALKMIAAISALCNDAQFDETEAAEMEKPSEIRKINGDATDTGILRFAEAIRPVNVTRGLWTEVSKLAFNSKNKFALKLLTPKSAATLSDAGVSPITASDAFDASDMLLLVKGAPDVIMRRCTKVINSLGREVELDEAARTRLIDTQEQLASQGQRVLLLARRIITADMLDKEVLSDASACADRVLELTQSLAVVGLVALIDPPRVDTADTVAVCRRAGIRFFVVTGDYALTATAIARSVGIITQPNERIDHLSDLPRDLPRADIIPYDVEAVDAPVRSLVLSGPDLMLMTESQWEQTIGYDEVVFARTTPDQKLRIVKAFQGKGNIVAVTGDGVNDAPALKQADVGIAIAGGSEVATEAADLVLLGDFSAIVAGIQYGRLVFDNLKKVILYLIPAGSFSELWPVIVNFLFGLPQPLSSLQMIIICVANDAISAFSLIYEKPESDLLLRKPRDVKKDRLANLKLLGQAYCFIGIIETTTSMVSAYYFGLHRRGIPFSALWLKYGNYPVDPDVLAEAVNHAQSLYFFNLVIMQMFNLLATRTRKLSLFQQAPLFNPATSNYRIFVAMFISFCIAILFSYIPFFQHAFLTRGIPVEGFFLPVAYGLGILVIDELRKLAVRTWPKGFLARIAW